MPEVLVSAEEVEISFSHGVDLYQGECNSWLFSILYSVQLM